MTSLSQSRKTIKMKGFKRCLFGLASACVAVLSALTINVLFVSIGAAIDDLALNRSSGSRIAVALVVELAASIPQPMADAICEPDFLLAADTNMIMAEGNPSNPSYKIANQLAAGRCCTVRLLSQEDVVQAPMFS